MTKIATLFLLVAITQYSIADPVELNCRIEPNMRVDISSAVEGVVAEVMVNKNDNVAIGQVLARLEAQLETATVDLRKLQANLNSDVEAQTLALDFSSRNLKRVQGLYNKKAASSAELDKAKTEHQLAEQQLKQAKERKQQADLEYRRALADLERRIVKSPIEGVVTAIYKDPGEHIYLEPIMQLVELDPLRVETFAPANLYGQFKIGEFAQVFPDSAIGQKSYTAEIVEVDRVIDAPSNTFGIVLSIANPNYRLPSGLKCRIQFTSVNSNVQPRSH